MLAASESEETQEASEVGAQAGAGLGCKDTMSSFKSLRGLFWGTREEPISKAWTAWGWEWWDVKEREVGSAGASLGGKRPYCEVASSSTLGGMQTKG